MPLKNHTINIGQSIKTIYLQVAVYIICPLDSSLSFSIDLSCKEIMDFEKGSGTVFHQEWIVDSIADGWDDG